MLLVIIIIMIFSESYATGSAREAGGTVRKRTNSGGQYLFAPIVVETWAL